jgi:hypothetical protein
MAIKTEAQEGYFNFNETNFMVCKSIETRDVSNWWEINLKEDYCVVLKNLF